MSLVNEKECWARLAMSAVDTEAGTGGTCAEYLSFPTVGSHFPTLLWYHPKPRDTRMPWGLSLQNAEQMTSNIRQTQHLPEYIKITSHRYDLNAIILLCALFIYFTFLERKGKVIRFLYLLAYFNGGGGDWTRDLVHAKPTLYHWTTPSPLLCALQCCLICPYKSERKIFVFILWLGKLRCREVEWLLVLNSNIVQKIVISYICWVELSLKEIIMSFSAFPAA